MRYLLIFLLVFFNSVAFGFGTETTKKLSDCVQIGYAPLGYEVYVWCDGDGDSRPDYVLSVVANRDTDEWVVVYQYTVAEAEAIISCYYGQDCTALQKIFDEEYK